MASFRTKSFFRRLSRFPSTGWRQFSQSMFFLVFIWLFLNTEYAGMDEISSALNILFRIDPLIAASAMLAAKTIIWLLLPSVVLVVLTLVFGRFFCGWVCPMGTLFDLVHRITGSGKSKIKPWFRSIKYWLLVFTLTGAFFGLPIVGYVDPFSILVRGLTLGIYPGIDSFISEIFTWTYRYAPMWVNGITEPVYAVLKATVLPFRSSLFAGSVVSGLLLVIVLLLERVEQRFFCKNLCPLGAFLGLLSRFALFKGRGGSFLRNSESPAAACGACRICANLCRMKAIDDSRDISAAACILCMDCVETCPREKIRFEFLPGQREAQAVALTRRQFLAAVFSGALVPLFFRISPLKKHARDTLIRPPGALPEADFIGRCVRCGECMKVCIGNALHPTLLDAGVDAAFTPKLVPRIGYCEYDCTLCGQVCPTGAIRNLTLQEKKQTIIGTAYFDTNRCLPFSGVPCIVCEEHCPTGDKAIKFRLKEVLNDHNQKVTVKQPYVVDSLCIGCGICENKCPLPGQAAVHVTFAGETRNPDHALHTETTYEGGYNF